MPNESVPIGAKSYPLRLVDNGDGTYSIAVSGGGGGGGGDASIAKQNEQIALLGAKTTSITNLEAGGVGVIGWLSQLWRDVVALSAKWQAGPGTEALAQRVTLASDGPGVTALNLTASRLPGATVAVLVDATAATVFSALAAGACRSVLIENNFVGAVDIDVQRGASGPFRVVPAGSWALFDAVTNANQLRIRRSDLSATQVTVSTELRT